MKWEKRRGIERKRLRNSNSGRTRGTRKTDRQPYRQAERQTDLRTDRAANTYKAAQTHRQMGNTR